MGMGIEPIRSEDHRFLRPARLPLRQPTKECEWGESNPHGLSTTSTSSWRDYHSTTFA